MQLSLRVSPEHRGDDIASVDALCQRNGIDDIDHFAIKPLPQFNSFALTHPIRPAMRSFVVLLPFPAGDAEGLAGVESHAAFFGMASVGFGQMSGRKS